MAAPTFFYKITTTFEAKTYPEFEVVFKKLCDTAGGGIKNFYQRTGKNQYIATFYYPTEKGATAGRKRLEALDPPPNSLEMHMPDIDFNNRAR